MTSEELRAIKRRLDVNQGVHIARWNKEMGANTVKDMTALIREVERCWARMKEREDGE